VRKVKGGRDERKDREREYETNKKSERERGREETQMEG
jgi:hypothetical protein